MKYLYIILFFILSCSVYAEDAYIYNEPTKQIIAHWDGKNLYNGYTNDILLTLKNGYVIYNNNDTIRFVKDNKIYYYNTDNPNLFYTIYKQNYLINSTNNKIVCKYINNHVYMGNKKVLSTTYKIPMVIISLILECD